MQDFIRNYLKTEKDIKNSNKKKNSKKIRKSQESNFPYILQTLVVMQGQIILNFKSISLVVTNNNDPKGE